MNLTPTGVIPRDRLHKLHTLLASYECHNDPRIADYRWCYTIGECLDTVGLSVMDFTMDRHAMRDTFLFLAEQDLNRARVFAQMVDAKLSDLRAAEKANRTRIYLDL